MTTFERIGLGLLMAFLTWAWIRSLTVLPSWWRGDRLDLDEHDPGEPVYWTFGNRAWNQARRVAWIVLPGAAPWFAYIWLKILMPSDDWDGVTNTLSDIFTALTVPVIALVLSGFLINRPTFLMPKRFRGDVGLFTAWLRKRRA